VGARAEVLKNKEGRDLALEKRIKKRVRTKKEGERLISFKIKFS